MITFHFGNKKFGPVPGSYNELSGRQLIGLAAIFAQGVTKDLARLMALKVLLNKSLLGFGLMSADAKNRIISPLLSDAGEEVQPGHIDWIFDTNTLTEQVLPKYRGYYGPGTEFDNLTLSEFHATEVNYHLLIQGDEAEKEGALNNLVAVLYRKPKWFYNKERNKDGDIRKPFNPNELPFLSKKIAAWPAPVKMAIVMYYDGCRQNLVSLYDKVFSGGDDGSDNDKIGRAHV